MVKINKNFHPRSIELVKAFDEGRIKLELDEYPFGSLVMYYEIALANNFKTAASKFEKELEIQGKSEYIVPRQLFTQFNPSMISLPFAEEVWKASLRSCADLGAACYQYFPPSYGSMIAYLLAVSFGKQDVADVLEHLIKSYPPVADSMPHFLELAQQPAIVDRIAELHKILESRTNSNISEELEPVEEDIEKHEELNPLLFEDNKLKKEVVERALAVADELVKMLEENNVQFKLKDLILTGSNASYNYTKDSDIDLHLVADLSEFEDPDGLYPIIYQAYKSAFNKKYEIDFYGIPVEVYIECDNTPLVSNGIYSVLNNEWVKEPEQVSIPDVDMDAIKKAIEPWEERYNKLVNDIEAGKLKDETEIDSFVNDLYETRAEGLKEGEYAEGNLIFKEMRNKGYLDNLKDLRDKVIGDKLTLESLTERLSNRDIDYYRTEIQRLTFEQPIIQPNGIFEIYNVKEKDTKGILDILRRQDFIDFVQVSASRYDFSTFARSGIPTQLYRIYGQIK